MKNKVMLWAVMVSGLLLLTSCQSFVALSHDELKREYIKKSEAEQTLRNVQDEYARKLADNETKISSAKDKVINDQDAQMQAAANAFYSINQVTSYYPQLGALEFTKDTAKLGMGSLGKPPTVKEIIEGGERMRKYLSSYASNNQDEIKKLKDENIKLLAENGLLVKNTEAAKTEVNKLTEEKATIKADKEVAVAAAQTNLNNVNNTLQQKSLEVIQAEKDAREKAEKLESVKREIMIWCGIGAALAMIGAVYSPVGKGGMALIAGILSFVAVAIMYIQPWMVLAVGLVGAFGAIAYMLYTHHVADKTADNLVNHIQDIKENPNVSNEIKQLVKQSLTEWNSKYTGDNTIKTDNSVEKYIKSKLKNHGRL